jgi:hypothetical protein
VLARLREESGVETADVDRRGELLRVRLSSTDVSRLTDLLGELGFLSEAVVDADVAAVRWYGLETISELSHEEAEVIAQRVVRSFAPQDGTGIGEIEGLSETVAGALHACFLADTVDASTPHGALSEACGRAVEQATAARLGGDRAAALGRAITGDLASRSALKE